MNINHEAVRTLDRRKLLGLIFLIVAFSLTFASRGLLSNYSYWLDELFSVSASMDAWGNLYSKWILPDVHPPLYQLLLKPWVGLLGKSEAATRSLSFLFSVITITVFSLESFWSREPRRILALLLIGVSPAFAYYSQETRSYSLMLMLASIVTFLVLSLKARAGSDPGSPLSQVSTKGLRIGYYIASILLALTHYFGWIYVFTLSCINFVSPSVEPKKIRTLALVFVVSLWPAWHVIVGGLASKSGGNFWIKVRPVVGTINAYLQGCLPPLAPSGSPYNFLIAWALLFCIVLMAFGSFGRMKAFALGSRHPKGRVADESRYLFNLILLMLAINCLIDLKTPMSTGRNFIVLLPATILLVSNGLHSLFAAEKRRGLPMARSASIAISVVLVSLLIVNSWRSVSAKISPGQNWKSLASYVKHSGVCSDECFVIGSYGRHRFYFNGSGFEGLRDLAPPDREGGHTLSLEEQLKLALDNQDVPVLGFHGASSVALPALTSSGSKTVCLQPSQGGANSTFIVLPKSRLERAGGPGSMAPCA